MSKNVKTRDWKTYWEERARKCSPTEFKQQVARTVDGKPVPDEEFQIAVTRVLEALDLQPSDRLLDLCCGNGLLTVRLAERCEASVGVDYARTMIELARRYHPRNNLTYYVASALDLKPEMFEAGFSFDKISILESLHYFLPADLPLLFRSIRTVSKPDVRIYITGIPDRSRIEFFYNTPDRWALHQQSDIRGHDSLGYWWDRKQLSDAANLFGFRCEFVQQDQRLNTAHYRFDLRLEGV